MMVVVAVKESPLLLAVNAVVSGVEVEDKMFRRRRMRGDELIDEDLRDLDQRLAIDTVFQSAKCRRRGQRRFWFRGLLRGNLENGIDAEGLVVVEIFVPQSDRNDTLGEHNALVVSDAGGVPGIGNGVVEGVEQSGRVGDLAKQKCPGVGCEPPSLKIGDDRLGTQGGKVKPF